MKIGIYGGSFDPIHMGHLILAETCRETCRLDEVWFVPANVPPHKLDRNRASAKHRLEMLQLATGGQPEFVVCDIEIQRGGTSYTVDTLSDLHQQHPHDQLYLVMGPDSLEEFSTWREPERICELAIPIVVFTGTTSDIEVDVLAPFASEQRLNEIRDAQVAIPNIEISSTDIRKRASDGRSLRYRIPASVAQYLHHHQLYR